MKLDKRYIKFFEVENNRYYVLPFQDELHIVTENVLRVQKKLLGFIKTTKETVQGLKLLELTAPILMLFQEIICADVENKDEDFPDMTTYKKVNNVELRKNLESLYKTSIDENVKQMKEDFENWLAEVESSTPNITEEDLRKIEKTNRDRLEQNIIAFKEHSQLNFMNFKWKTGDNTIVKKMLDNNMEFLYAQKIGSNYKIYYLYDLDVFGTVTIYKIHTVKETVKTIETFIYNREIIQELIACIANNNL